MLQTIEQLAEKRQRWIDANRENNFEEGIKKLLTELYPDNAHFIYELLQNAEDTGASVVRFTLSESAIDFEHNGQRLFNLKDIDSITSIGVSTKRDDPTNIGKFGVGFKAVFAYTETPEIHSGKFHFRIKDMVVPTVDNVESLSLNANETRFTFPFNHQVKKPVKAVEEIERGLRALGANTLLFLSHIRLVEYLLPDGSLGYLERTDHKNGHIEILARPPGGEETVSYWLRYQKNVEIADEDGSAKKCQVAIAYSLQPEEQKKKKQPEWRIVPLEHGQVSIYFPAEKETSNLRFHIHAPFASTVARDSVRDCNENIQLLDSISQLLVESFDDILARRMLTMGFLAVLPNEMEQRKPFYQPIRMAAVQAFRKKPLTPTRSGTHASATSLYRGPAKIAEVICDDGLALLTSSEPPLWVANPPPQSQPQERFLDSLKIKDWGWSELSNSLSWLDDDKKKRVEIWITQKDDAWIMRFYALLGDPPSDTHFLFVKLSRAANLRIVRVVLGQGQGHEHVIPGQAFFSPEQEDATPPDNICFVKPAVYKKGKSVSQKQHAVEFLEQIGVKSYDALAICKLRLVEYNKGVRKISKNQHLKDVTNFVAVWCINPNNKDLFKKIAFLNGITANGTKNLCKAADLYLDHPYDSTDLSDLFASPSYLVSQPKHKLSDEYQKIKNFAEFAKAIGVMWQLEICKSSATKMQSEYFKKTSNKTSTTIDEDYFINGLHWYRKGSNSDIGRLRISDFHLARNFSLSRTIWRAMCSADPKSFKAMYVPNKARSHLQKNKSSFLIDYLKKTSWLPDYNGVFRKPADVDRETLRHDFKFDDKNGWLTAIEFGKGIEERKEAQRLEQEQQTAEYKHKEEIAKEMGFESPEEAEETAKLRRENPEEFEKWKEEMRLRKQTPAFPERPVPNPERRQEKMGEQLSESPEKNYEKRSRSVRTTNSTIDPTTWLRNHYTNVNDQMVCQICKEEMPFRKRDGKHYFEKKEVLSRDFLKKEHEAQYLALCPLCAAKYEEFVKKEDDAMTNLHESIVNAASCEVPIVLGAGTTSIRFVEAHLLDLQTIIECMD